MLQECIIILFFITSHTLQNMDQVIIGDKTISDITLDDVISLYMMDIIQDVPLIDDYFGKGPNNAWSYDNEIMLKKYPEKNCGLLVLIYCLVRIYRKNTMPVKILQPNGSGIIKFHPDFLENCWNRACNLGIQNHKFGDVIKSLGYHIHISTKKFENQYRGYKKKTVDELDIDDIIYLFMVDNPLDQVNTTSPREIYTYEVVYYTALTYKFFVNKYKKEDFDKIALINCAMFATNNFDINFFGRYCSYYVSKEFLEQCWSKICEYDLQHHRIGNVIKKLKLE